MNSKKSMFFSPIMVLFILLSCSLAFEPNASRSDNLTWYHDECLMNNNTVCASLQPYQDFWTIGDVSVWLVPSFIVIMFLVALVSKNAGSVGFAHLLLVTVLNRFLPVHFSLYSLAILAVPIVLIVKAMLGEE